VELDFGFWAVVLEDGAGLWLTGQALPSPLAAGAEVTGLPFPGGLAVR
jgi:hypothetical protein